MNLWWRKDTARRVGATRPSGGKGAEASLQVGLHWLLPWEGLNVLVHVLNFSNVSNAGTAITISTQLFSKPYCDYFNSVVTIKKDINNKSVKYLQDVNFSQLPVTEKTQIKNRGRATPHLVISQS